MKTIALRRLAGIAQALYRLAGDWTVRGSNPGGDEISRTCPGARPAFFSMGSVCLSHGKGGQGVTLTTHPI